MITDRNGQILAISLPTVALFADPRQIIDAAEAAHRLKKVLPRIDEEAARTRLSDTNRQFVYLERQITPREELAINSLGIPGIDFRPTEQRRYPMGRTAAQVLGGVDVDEHGVAGVEKYFDQRLFSDASPLRLSIDVRVQAVVRDELSKAIEFFQAIGGCGIVMDVNTGEVLAMVSLPDYDANEFRTAPADDRFNRAVTGMYEPGSTFKLQTAVDGAGFRHRASLGSVRRLAPDPHRPLHHHRLRGQAPLALFARGACLLLEPRRRAHRRDRGRRSASAPGSGRMGMFARIGIELPEAGLPIVQSAAAWKQVVTLTVAFGHGISVSPLHVVRGTAAVANGGVLVRPTILALPPGEQPEGVRVMQPSTSDTMRRLMRLVVTDGFGKQAEVAGYYPGGKTGTAEKVGKHGYKRGFKESFNVAAFISVFPMNAPRYAVYMMVDEPHGNKSTYGYSTAGWVAAPAAGRVIARIAPMLGLLPDIQDAPTINQALHIPLQPARPAGAPRGPVAAAHPAPDAGVATSARRPAPAKPSLTIPATTLPPAQPIRRDPRHEAVLPTAPVTDASVALRAVRRNRLRLADIMRQVHALADGAAPASWRSAAALGDRRHHRRQPARGARVPVCRAPRQPCRRTRLHRRGRVARRGGGAGAGRDTQWPPGVPPRPLLEDPEPRRRLAQIAAGLAGRQPKIVVAVTGTNGKTSTVEFLRQLWAACGRQAASLGTLGLIAPGFEPGPGLTTPDPVSLAETLARLARAGVQHAAMEASSHGLDQFRLDGVRLTAAAFTNLTRDHLDYHGIAGRLPDREAAAVRGPAAGGRARGGVQRPGRRRRLPRSRTSPRGGGWLFARSARPGPQFGCSRPGRARTARR